MAIQLIRNQVNLVGLSTDTKPTKFGGEDVGAGSTFWESDTNNHFEYDGNSWVQKSTGGTVHGTERMVGTFSSATIADGTPVVMAMSGAPLPCTVDLKSAAAGRLIEWSADNGTTYFTAAYDYTTAAQLVFFVNMPVTHVRVTGTTNDTYRIF